MIIHILKHGSAYCGKIGVPRDWGDGHRWVSFEDDWESKATCEICRGFAAMDPMPNLRLPQRAIRRWL